MPKMSKANKRQGSAFEAMRGGKLPESVVRRLFADVKRNLAAELKEKSAIQQQAAKYFSQIRKPIANVVGDNAEAARAVSGLRGITDRLAKQKLTIPGTAKVLPGILAGSYTLRFTPPYIAFYTKGGESFADYGNPTISTVEDADLGQLSCSIATDFKSPSAGWAMSVMGIYFRPIFGPATLRVWFDSETAFSWYVNSLGPDAKSEARGLIEIYEFPRLGSYIPKRWESWAFLRWAEDAANELKFDFGSMPGPNWYLELPTVSPSYVYLVTIWLVCQASGAGWPGSLAGANASVAVPSITVEVTLNPQILSA